MFFQKAAGAGLATTAAVILMAAGLAVHPSFVVAAGIIVLLSGLSLFGAIQDPLNGFGSSSARRWDRVLRFRLAETR